MKKERRDVTISFRAAAWVKERAREQFERDKRAWRSFGEYAAHLFTEAVLRELPAKDVARLQREAARGAERKAG